MLKFNRRLGKHLNPKQIAFLNVAPLAIQSLLPHIEIEEWVEDIWKPARSVWASPTRTEIRITIAIGEQTDSAARSLTTTIRRRSTAKANKSIDLREYDICRLIADRIDQVLKQTHNSDTASIQAIIDSFDEYIVSSHIQAHHKLVTPIAPVIGALHKLSEQSYENKSLTFGCILDPDKQGAPSGTRFPQELLQSKKYKALSDGFRTAYTVSTDGRVLDFVDLEKFGNANLSKKHHFPDWAEAMAQSSRDGKCGIALSRQGDILIFDEGTLRFTYRYGRWQYWNHNHLLNLLRHQARAQGVPPRLIGRVVGAIYRAAMDVSFRRSGGLFVILHNRKHLRKVVRTGDAIGDRQRASTDQEFDEFLSGHTIQSLSRVVAVELASLDGAVVLNNSGGILAYGAVLQPKKAGRLRGTEGSRTKAAIGASNYGLAIKISSDGEICIYSAGNEFIRV